MSEKLVRLEIVNVNTDAASVVYHVRLEAGENRFNPSFCKQLSIVLDDIESDMNGRRPAQTKAALLTSGNGRFFSNGLDLQHLMTTPNPNDFLAHTYRPLIARLLAFGLPSVALANGHTFAAGMVLALAHDYRLVPSPSHFLWSMNELLIRAAIPAGMLAILKCKLASPQVLRDCILARRWNVEEAHRDGLVDCLLGSDQPFDEAIQFAASKAVPLSLSPILSAIKRETYRDTYDTLLNPNSDSQDPFRFAKPSKL
jgi:enoyl-CoA hydratase/carnithine racemase